MDTIILKNNKKELQNFIKKANRKLLELDVLQSVWELKKGKGRIYKSSADLMSHISSKVN